MIGRFRRTVGPGLEMRLFDPADAVHVVNAVERNRGYLREWLPWVDATRNVSDVEEFIGRCRTQWDNGLGPQCSVWFNGALAGSVGVHPIDWNDRQCSIGYWLDEALQGHGIITRCCASMLDYLVGEQGLHRVEIRCGTANLRSAAVPQRLGFQREGVLREAEWVNDRWVDLIVWSILQDEWGGLTGT